MMGWRGVNRGSTVLRGRPGWRMVHKRGHLTNEVSGRRGDGWGDRRQWRRGLVENHVRCVRALSRVRHGVIDGGRGRRGSVVLLRWRHHVMRMGHDGLTWIVSGVMVRGWSVAGLGK